MKRRGNLDEQSRDRHDLREPIDRVLESRADELGSDLRSPDWDDAPTAMLDREIALVLDQIRAARELEERLCDSLLDTECRIDTELAQMEERTPRYSPHRFPEREKLHKRLHLVEIEGRRLRMTHAEKMAALHERLLSLLQKRAMLDF